MIRGTTPTHYWDSPVDVNVISKVNVLYAQDDKLLFKKKTPDCDIDKDTGVISTRLTREESLMFNHKSAAQVQAIIETAGGDVIESLVLTIGVDKLLDDGVIE